MKKYLVFFVFAFIAIFTFGQNNYEDVVYLKNGSIIRGVIIEQIPNKSIKIETADRNVFVFQIDEIEKLTKEPYKGKRANSINNTSLDSGYNGIVEFGYQIGIGLSNLEGLKLNIINGYKVNPYFSLGFGTGLRYYSTLAYTGRKLAMIPFFADFRANFNDNKLSPYVSVGLGYSLSAVRYFRGGLLFNPTVGISYKVSDKSAINAGLGYELQRFIYDYDGYYYGDSNNSVSLNVGISF